MSTDYTAYDHRKHSHCADSPAGGSDAALCRPAAPDGLDSSQRPAAARDVTGASVAAGQNEGVEQAYGQSQDISAGRIGVLHEDNCVSGGSPCHLFFKGGVSEASLTFQVSRLPKKLLL